MKTLWLYLHFPHLQLDTLFSQREVTHPVVILDGKKNTVVQLNGLAYKAGIRSKMGLGTAAALDQSLQVIPYQSEIERNRLQEIAEWLYLVTSDISFYPPNGLLLRIHNMLNLYSGLQPYWLALKGQLASLKLTYHYATGDSPYACRMLARTGWDQITDDIRLIKQQVNQCTLQQTELTAKVIHKLNRVGIHSVNDLLKLPLKDVAKRFDIELVTYLGRLTGEFQHPVSFFHPPEYFHRYLELLYSIENIQYLQHPLQKLFEALEQFLKIRDQLTQQLIITLHQRECDDLPLEVHSAEGEYQAQRWTTLSALTLENVKLTAPVFAITLSTGKTHVRTPDKTDLFSGKKGALSNLQLISLLQAKLGEQAVQGLAVQDDFRPERVSHYSPPFQPSSIKFNFQTLRPSFLLNTPRPLQQKVSIVHGPERLDTGWWDNHQVTRDYFIAHSEVGQWCWVFRTPNGKWFLHGIFS
jgi:protein ImuB